MGSAGFLIYVETVFYNRNSGCLFTGRAWRGLDLSLPAFESACPFAELQYAVLTESPQALDGLFNAPLSFRMAFRVELVGVADNLFLQRLRHKVGRGNVYVQHLQLLRRESGAGVAFADACQLFVARTKCGIGAFRLMAQDFGTQYAVMQIRCFAMTVDSGSIAAENPHIVQHGSVFQETPVQVPLRMSFDNLFHTLRHLPAVVQQQAAQIVVRRIIFSNDFFEKHGVLTFLDGQS